MEKVFRKIKLSDSEQEDICYWKTKTPEEKLDTLQLLREIYYEFKNESRKGFQRVYRIVKQKQG